MFRRCGGRPGLKNSLIMSPRIALGPDDDEGRATGDADLGGRLGVRALPMDRAWQRIAATQVEIQIIRLSCRRTGRVGGLGRAGLTLRPAGAHEIELARQAYDGGDCGEASREYERGDGAMTAHADAEDEGQAGRRPRRVWRHMHCMWLRA
jgi:hypothetical protein